MILRRHIGKTVIASTLLVLVIFIGVQFFIGFVKQLNEIGSGNYHLLYALEYVLLTMPFHVYSFFPMIALLGSLLGLGYLASHSELVVMQAAGFSRGQIIGAVMRAAALLLCFMLVVGEGVGPHAMYAATLKKTEAKNKFNALNTQYGLWLRNGYYFIRIGRMDSNTRLSDVNQYQVTDQSQLVQTMHADHAVRKHGKWYLENLKQTELRGTHTLLKQYPEQRWHLRFTPRIFSLSEMDSGNMSLLQLHQLISIKKKNGLDHRDLSLMFWQRVFQPFAALVMIFLAIPFVFGPLRSVAMGLRLVSGIAIGFSFYLLDRFFGPFSMVYNIPPFLSALLPLFLFFILGLGLFRSLSSPRKR
ncbi:MAG: LPS export ABC transporter permease LptG [Pseudomonadota bacterium]|nr:LPS export ABC transporter permease LptG [Gammaproteobacteria bacterium]MBU1629061.1 LPS export ABC transporter permease LptG [Gammaproteobacteria bacterium]MBU1926386.1 LPS export ABC transporter permease LptG [Gammaproteobacteria bacterium]